jgi:hypothetical protein
VQDEPLSVYKSLSYKELFKELKIKDIKINRLNYRKFPNMENFLGIKNEFSMRFIALIKKMKGFNSKELNHLRKIFNEVENLDKIFRRRNGSRFVESVKFKQIYRYNSNNKLYIILKSLFNFFKNYSRIKINDKEFKNVLSTSNSLIINDILYLVINLMKDLKSLEKYINIRSIILSFLGFFNPRSSKYYKLNLYMRYKELEPIYKVSNYKAYYSEEIFKVIDSGTYLIVLINKVPEIKLKFKYKVKIKKYRKPVVVIEDFIVTVEPRVTTICVRKNKVKNVGFYTVVKRRKNKNFIVPDFDQEYTFFTHYSGELDYGKLKRSEHRLFQAYVGYYSPYGIIKLKLMTYETLWSKNVIFDVYSFKEEFREKLKKYNQSLIKRSQFDRLLFADEPDEGLPSEDPRQSRPYQTVLKKKIKQSKIAKKKNK